MKVCICRIDLISKSQGEEKKVFDKLAQISNFAQKKKNMKKITNMSRIKFFLFICLRQGPPLPLPLPPPRLKL